MTFWAAVHAAEPDKQPIRVDARRSNTEVVVRSQGETTTIDVRSPFGIDRATITRVGKEWSRKVVLRLHLKGLESLRVTAGNRGIEWSVSSSKKPKFRMALHEGGKETPLKNGSPFWTEGKIVAEDVKIPLKDGYFEVAVPGKLLEGNPETIAVRWIDFYRG